MPKVDHLLGRSSGECFVPDFVVCGEAWGMPQPRPPALVSAEWPEDAAGRGRARRVLPSNMAPRPGLRTAVSRWERARARTVSASLGQMALVAASPLASARCPG